MREAGANLLERELGDLRRARDEIRLQMHLAGMELKERWSVMEPETERLINGVAEISHEAMEQMIGKLRKFQAALNQKQMKH